MRALLLLALVPLALGACTQSLAPFACANDDECAGQVCTNGVCVDLPPPDGGLARADAGLDVFDAGLELDAGPDIDAGPDVDAGPPGEGEGEGADCALLPIGTACNDAEACTADDRCTSAGCFGVLTNACACDSVDCGASCSLCCREACPGSCACDATCGVCEQTCTDDQCALACTEGSCVFVVDTDVTDTTESCNGGRCAALFSGEGKRDLQCSNDALCETVCTSTECKSKCETGSTCDYECAGAVCDLDCLTGAQCVIDCQGGADCGKLKCNDASCEVECGGTSDCALDCQGSADCRLSCPAAADGADVCDLTCAAGTTCALECGEGQPCSCTGATCAVTCGSAPAEVCPNDTDVFFCVDSRLCPS